jgi:hypothetical protein
VPPFAPPSGQAATSGLGASAVGGSSSSAGSSQATSAASSPAPPSPNRAAAQSPKAQRLRSSRHWIGIGGKKERRSTTLTFVLSQAGKVVFTVRQLSPSCRTVGRFTVHGHTGLNRFRFAARIGRERLGVGTYRITANTAAGRSVRRVTLVVVDGAAPTPSDLIALRSANRCGAANGIASTAAVESSGASSSGVLAGSEQVDGSFSGGQPSASAFSSSGPPDAGGVLASTAERTAQGVRPALVALLIAAIALLGLASLPRVGVTEPRFDDVLVRHRLEIAGLGAAVLIAVVVAFLV